MLIQATNVDGTETIFNWKINY